VKTSTWKIEREMADKIMMFFFSPGFYSPYLRTLAFLNGLLDPQLFGRAPWLGDQSNARPLPTHRTTQHRNTQTHIHAPSRTRTCDLNVQAVVDSTCLRPVVFNLFPPRTPRDTFPLNFVPPKSLVHNLSYT
jgi:hypothetical protein